MSKTFEELDFRSTPMGELFLRRRKIFSLGIDVYEVKLGDAFLMSSLFHFVEEELARLALRELEVGEWDVVVGGLGLGYTARAALAHESVRSLAVVEVFAPVIEWHQHGLVPLGRELTADPRCHFVKGDFFALARSERGFDSDQPGRRFAAVLLDIDHSPRDLLHSRHGAFYEPAGLRLLVTHLRPGGVFALWSDEPPDEDFMDGLGSVFSTCRAHIVTFPNPLTEEDSASTVYVAGL